MDIGDSKGFAQASIVISEFLPAELKDKLLLYNFAGHFVQTKRLFQQGLARKRI